MKSIAQDQQYCQPLIEICKNMKLREWIKSITKADRIVTSGY